MSKFKDILKAAQERDTEESTASPEIKSSPARQPEAKPQMRGRPKGKRSNPDYEQVTAYIRKETYRQTKIALLQQGEVKDFSELIEKLLTEWLREQNSQSSDI